MKVLLAFCLLCLLYLHCGFPPPSNNNMLPFSLDSYQKSTRLGAGQGSGDIILCENGSKVSLGFDIKWQGDSLCYAQFTNTLGMTVASAKTISQALWHVDFGDTQCVVQPSDIIRFGLSSYSYPISWLDFLHCVTSQMSCHLDSNSSSNSIDKKSNQTIYLWDLLACGTQKFHVCAKVDNKTQYLAEVLYVCISPNEWRLKETDFHSGYAKEIRCDLSNNNYFYVKYHSLSRKILSKS